MWYVCLYGEAMGDWCRNFTQKVSPSIYYVPVEFQQILLNRVPIIGKVWTHKGIANSVFIKR